MRPFFVTLISILAPIGCSSSGDFTYGTDTCTLNNNLTLDGGSNAWTECRASRSTILDTFEVQLVTPGTSGSYVSLGPGWLEIEFNIDEKPGSLNAAWEAWDEFPMGTCRLTYEGPDNVVNMAKGPGICELTEYHADEDGFAVAFTFSDLSCRDGGPPILDGSFRAQGTPSDDTNN